MIRAATEKDYPALLKLAHEFAALGELDGTGLECDDDSIIASFKLATIFVYEADGKIIGSVAGMITPWMFNRNQIIAYEQWWFVPERYRRNHPLAAFRLLNAFLAWGKGMGASTVVLAATATSSSVRVQEFYKKKGLRLVDSNYIGRC